MVGVLDAVGSVRGAVVRMPALKIVARKSVSVGTALLAMAEVRPMIVPKFSIEKDDPVVLTPE